MKKERFGMETEPYKLFHKYNMKTIYVGDGFHPVPKKSFCYSLFYQSSANFISIFFTGKPLAPLMPGLCKSCGKNTANSPP